MTRLIWISCFLVSVWKSVDCSCTFPSEMEGVWYSAHKGALTFNSTHVTGYPIYMSFAVQSLDFTCYQQSGRKYLLRATETALVFGQDIRGYLCIQLWRVSSTKYYYYLGTSVSFTNNDNIYGRVDAVVVDTSTACNQAEPYTTGAFIMLVKDEISATNSDNIYGIRDNMNATLDEACNRPEPYNTSAFVMLVKDGEASSGGAEATCPIDLLAKFSSVSITDSTGSTSCSGSSVDVCTDRTEMNYTIAASCGSSLKFSSGNYWVCLHSISDGSYQYLAVWNNDTTVDGSTTYRFTCYAISSSGGTVYASVHPNYCSDSSQTPTSVPSPGTIHVYSGATEICYEEVLGGSSGVYYATIVIGVFFLISLVILFICLYKKGCCAAMKRRCQKRPTSATSSTESSVDQGDQVTRSVFSSTAKKLKPIPGFKAKRPLRVGPIVEPSLEPLPKVEPLYAIIDPMKKRLLEAWLRSEGGTSSKFETLSGDTPNGPGQSGRVEVSIDINVHDYDSNLPSPRRPSNARKLRFTRSFQLPDCSAALTKETLLSKKRKKGQSFCSPRSTTEFQNSYSNKNLLPLPSSEGGIESKDENATTLSNGQTDKSAGKSVGEGPNDTSEMSNEIRSSAGLMVAMDIVQDELDYTIPTKDSCVTLPHKTTCECKECCPHKEDSKEESSKENNSNVSEDAQLSEFTKDGRIIKNNDVKAEVPKDEPPVKETTECLNPENCIMETEPKHESMEHLRDIEDVTQMSRSELEVKGESQSLKTNKPDKEDIIQSPEMNGNIENKVVKEEKFESSTPEQEIKVKRDEELPVVQSESARPHIDKVSGATQKRGDPKKKTPDPPERSINRNQESVIKKIWSVKATPNDKSAPQKTKYSRQTYNDPPKRRETSFKKPEQEIISKLDDKSDQIKSSEKDFESSPVYQEDEKQNVKVREHSKEAFGNDKESHNGKEVLANPPEDKIEMINEEHLEEKEKPETVADTAASEPVIEKN